MTVLHHHPRVLLQVAIVVLVHFACMRTYMPDPGVDTITLTEALKLVEPKKLYGRLLRNEPMSGDPLIVGFDGVEYYIALDWRWRELLKS